MSKNMQMQTFQTVSADQRPECEKI